MGKGNLGLSEAFSELVFDESSIFYVADTGLCPELAQAFEGATGNPTYRKSTGQLSSEQEDVAGPGLDSRQSGLWS